MFRIIANIFCKKKISHVLEANSLSMVGRSSVAATLSDLLVPSPLSHSTREAGSRRRILEGRGESEFG